MPLKSRWVENAAILSEWFQMIDVHNLCVFNFPISIMYVYKVSPGIGDNIQNKNTCIVICIIMYYAPEYDKDGDDD